MSTCNPKLMGILNITPDSFSDGGNFLQPDAALKKLDQLIKDGADIIDIGAESTRPGSTPLEHDEEWKRLEPIIKGLSRTTSTISLDTRHALTATAALKSSNIHWINDVNGFKDPAMLQAVKQSSCKLVVTHSLTVPADKNITLPENEDVVQTIINWAKETINRLNKNDISSERIILDPGIGFGKSHMQSWQLIRCAKKLVESVSVPWLYGHSRKGFLSTVTELPAVERDIETLSVSQWLVQQGVQYLRVHDIAAHKRMLNTLKVTVYDA